MGEREEEVCVLALPCSNVETSKNHAKELKRELGCVVNEAEFVGNKHAKVCPWKSNIDDISSEVLDPIVSTANEIDNADDIANDSEIPSSLETTTSHQIVDLAGKGNNGVNSDDTTCESSGNSCTMSSCDEVSRSRGLSGVSTSQVTLEIPEHASTTGIRKITFKFSKSRKEYESKLSGRVFANGVHDGDSVIDFNDELGLDDTSDHFMYNMELKMSKKVVPDHYPTNVKKLLGTGILEGARVKYISTSGEVL